MPPCVGISSGGGVIGMMLKFLLCFAGLSLVKAASDASRCYWAGPRVDCGYPGISQDVCEDKGCCWMPVDFKAGPGADLPWCFHSNTGPSDYTLMNEERIEGGGLQGDLELRRRAQKELGPDVEVAELLVEEVSDTILRLRITDAVRKRWEIPRHLFKSEVLQGSRRTRRDNNGNSLYELSYQKDPFTFQILRRNKESGSTGRTVFNTTGTRLVFKDQYLELTTWVHQGVFLYGAGQRSTESLHLRRNGLPHTLWNQGLGPTFLMQNSYGSHPFVMAVEPGGSSWGALLFNSNGMDIVATEDRLSWRVIGGIIDLYIFMGPTPLAVMDQFTRVVGRPALMPYWTLGWHQSKYGYKSVWEVEEVVANYSAAGIPLETIWMDIDHMDGWKDFTFEPRNYPLQEVQRFVDQLHRNEQRWVPIVDVGIKVDPGYSAYDRGKEMDVFIQGVDGKPYLGWVWPGACHFPDFFHPKAQDYFTGLLEDHHAQVPWDGIWVDMNEPSNFCTGDICELPPGASGAPDREISVDKLRDDPPWVCHLHCKEPSRLNSTMKKLLNPPYQISNCLSRAPLGTKGMSVVASHHSAILHYDAHNLYSLSQVQNVAEAVQFIRGKRPFVLTRSSFSGTGAYAASWTGDNAATWLDLAWSITGVLNDGLFGIPMGGADICGFQGETTEELCSRWVALGAFYPFARDHSDLHSSYQELYRWPRVAQTGRKVLGMRYRLLPFLYTMLHMAHDTGAPVMRPLFMNFPEDGHTHGNSRQFMLGDAMLVTPVLEQSASQVEGYFPRGLWYSVWDTKDVVDASEGGRTVTLDAPLGDIPVHQRGGTIVAMQEAHMTTSQVKQSPLTLAVALPRLVTEQTSDVQQALRAAGYMYNDDGESAEAGDSPCDFLSFIATVDYHLLSNTHAAEVLVQFGRPGKGMACGADASGPGGWEWPALAAIEVWGWQRAVGAARVEVLMRRDGCKEFEVVQSTQLGSSQVLADGHGLKVDIAPLHLKLKCMLSVRVSWASSSAPNEDAVLSA